MAVRFEGTPIAEILSNGNLELKFKQTGVPNKAVYELSGQADLTYIDLNVKTKTQEGKPKVISLKVQSNLQTSSSKDGIVNGTLKVQLPAPKLGTPKVLALVKYHGLILENKTASVRVNVAPIERKFHAVASVRVAGAAAPTTVEVKEVKEVKAIEPVVAPVPVEVKAAAPVVTVVAPIVAKEEEKVEVAEKSNARIDENGVLTIDLEGWKPLTKLVINLK